MSTPERIAALLKAAKDLRREQVAYMELRSQRGGPMFIANKLDQQGKRVADAASVLDAAIAQAEPVKLAVEAEAAWAAALSQQISEIIARLERQPHEPPCLRGSTRARGECSCWIGRAVDFLKAALLASEDEHKNG